AGGRGVHLDGHRRDLADADGHVGLTDLDLAVVEDDFVVARGQVGDEVRALRVGELGGRALQLRRGGDDGDVGDAVAGSLVTNDALDGAGGGRLGERRGGR